jgi:hypothetical protein
MTPSSPINARLTNSVIRRARGVSETDFDGDLILATSDARYFTLSGASVQIWNWLQQPLDGRALGDRIMAAFETHDETWEAQTRTFLDHMSRLGLIVVEPGDSVVVAEPRPDNGAERWNAPAVTPMAPRAGAKHLVEMAQWTDPSISELRAEHAMTGINNGSEIIILLS